MSIIYYDYNLAKNKLKRIGINNKEKWDEYKNSENFDYYIPKLPDRFYMKKGQWISWPDFLNDINMKDCVKKYYSYDECKKIIQDNKILDRKDLKKWINDNRETLFKMKYKIPSDPYTVYKKTGEWISFVDFFGIDKKKKYSYNEAKEYIKKFHFQTKQEFVYWTKMNNFENGIPKAPREYYTRRGQWISWDDFFSKKR